MKRVIGILLVFLMLFIFSVSASSAVDQKLDIEQSQVVYSIS